MEQIRGLIGAASRLFFGRAAIAPAQEDVPFDRIPDELVTIIFSYLDNVSLLRASRVSHRFQLIANGPPFFLKSVISAYKAAAFSSKIWAESFFDPDILQGNCKKDFSRLPLTIGKESNDPCPFWPETAIEKTHILVWIPETVGGVPLTLNKFGELLKKYFPNSPTGYSHIWSDIGDEPIGSSYWVMMTKEPLRDSGKYEYVDLKAAIAELARKTGKDYRVARTLEAAICIFAKIYSDTQPHSSPDVRTSSFFEGCTPCYTYCRETVKKASLDDEQARAIFGNRLEEPMQAVVGKFVKEGLTVNGAEPGFYRTFGQEFFGIAPIRTL